MRNYQKSRKPAAQSTAKMIFELESPSRQMQKVIPTRTWLVGNLRLPIGRNVRGFEQYFVQRIFENKAAWLQNARYKFLRNYSTNEGMK